MKLVQYSSEKQITLSPSTHKDGLDIKFEDKVIMTLIPDGYDNVKVVLPIGSKVQIVQEEYKSQITNVS